MNNCKQILLTNCRIFINEGSGDNHEEEEKDELLKYACVLIGPLPPPPPGSPSSPPLNSSRAKRILSIDIYPSSPPDPNAVVEKYEANGKNNGDTKTNTSLKYVDCGGHILSPGFIDLQLNGAYGVDFSSENLTLDDIIKVAKALPEFGVTSFCPTIISSCPSIYRRNIHLFRKLLLSTKNQVNDDGERTNSSSESGSTQSGCSDSSTRSSGDQVYQDEYDGATILGLHLEGPFFAMSKRGAHNAKCIRETVSMVELSNTYSAENINDGIIKIITMAPELPGALSTIQSLTAGKIVVSMGHTDANLKQGAEAVASGARLITHLFNAMKPFHHREPGLLGLLQYGTEQRTRIERSMPSVAWQQKPTKEKEEDSIDRDKANQDDTSSSFDSPYFSIIVDGLHSHPTSVKMAHALNPNKLVLVTDAMSAMGLGGGLHSLGTMSVQVDGVNNTRATIAGTDTLAGSVVSIDTCVRNFKQFTGCTLKQAICAATTHPAKVLNCGERFGSLSVGSRADLVLLDDDLNVVKTWVGGKLVYSQEKLLGKRKC